MSDCNTRQESLKAYLDGEVSLSQSLALRLHLLRCESCRKEISEMQRLSLKLKNANSPLPSALRDRILNSVSYEEAQLGIQLAKPVFGMKPVLAWGGAFASLLIAVALGSKFLYSPQYKPDAASPSQSAQSKTAATATSPVKNEAFKNSTMDNNGLENNFEKSPSIKPSEVFAGIKGSPSSLASPAFKSAPMNANGGKRKSPVQELISANPTSDSETLHPSSRVRSKEQTVDSSEAERNLQNNASGLRAEKVIENRKDKVSAISPLPSSVQDKTSKQSELNPELPESALKSEAFNASGLSTRPINKNRLEPVPSGSGKKSKTLKRGARKKNLHKSGRAAHKKNN